MQFGVCCGPEMAPIVRQPGYDYVEGSVGGLLRPKESPEAFADALAAVDTIVFGSGGARRGAS